MAVAGVDQEDLEPLGLEQLVQGDPVDAGRFQGDRVDLMLTQEGGDGLQAVRVGRELSNQAGSGVGGEADADPVGAGADVDAGGVRVLHGQGFDLGGLPLATGFALELGPGLATLVGLAVGLGLSLLAAGRRGGGGWRLVVGAVMGELREQRRERDRRPCPEAVCGGVGSDGSHVTVANGNHAIPGTESPGRGHQ